MSPDQDGREIGTTGISLVRASHRLSELKMMMPVQAEVENEDSLLKVIYRTPNLFLRLSTRLLRMTKCHRISTCPLSSDHRVDRPGTVRGTEAEDL